jgi:hypothetical protein
MWKAILSGGSKFISMTNGVCPRIGLMGAGSGLVGAFGCNIQNSQIFQEDIVRTS